MSNGFQRVFVDEREKVLTLESTASFLGMSTATVRNWVKCGYLKTLSYQDTSLFSFSEIENVKLKITSGHFEKLNKRANKSNAGRTFIPEEYMQNKNGFSDLNNLVEFILQRNVDSSLALLLVCLNFLQKEKIIPKISIKEINDNENLCFTNKRIKEEIKSWFSAIKTKINEEYSYLLNCDLPKQRDALGFIYQSVLIEGKKSRNGSYFTPPTIVDEIAFEYVKSDSKVLDPCCGTGQFLLAFSKMIKNPSNIYGLDIDEIAVRIARINLLVHYVEKDFCPNIFLKNTLFDIGNYNLFNLADKAIRDFDVIATNPPWGLHFSTPEVEELKRAYPEISSCESFAYFLKTSHDLLKNGGILSFILPESVLNVKTHRDIRRFILNNSRIRKVICLDRVFKNVFTPVIRLDIEKTFKDAGDIVIQKENANHAISQSRWKSNQDYVFDIDVNESDAEIINKIYSTRHTTLKNQSEWALGIVTGSNSRHITDSPKEGYEEVYKGKDVQKFTLKKPSSFIRFTPDKFQQVAPIERYRAKEKLIYRFISKNIICAYDNQQKLTLNSANIVIPKIRNYPIKAIAALFNSSLYQFIFQKKFSSIKVLRSHIETLPLPLWDKLILNEIVSMVNGVIKGQFNMDALDEYIMDQYSLSATERNYIKEFSK